MPMHSVHAPNTEINTDNFDYVGEWQHLRRLTGVNALAVGLVVGADLHFVNHVGPGIAKGFVEPNGDDEAAPRFTGMVVVQYRKGKLLGLNGQRGEAREYRCNPKFYHRDRVAELLRRDVEAV